MISVRKVLLENLNNSSLEDFTNCVKKCINQGIVAPSDLKLFSERTIEHIHKLSLSHASSLLHSFAVPIYRNFQLFSCLSGRILELVKLEPPSPVESVKIINSCGRLHYSDSQLFTHLLKVVKSNLGSLRTKHVVSVLHSLTKLRYTDDDLLTTLSLTAAENLSDISDVALANFSIAASKIYPAEKTLDEDMILRGRQVMASLLPEINSRCGVSSPIDNLRHVIALANMKHLSTNQDELKGCLDNLVRFQNCSVLYYEHLLILFESLVTLGHMNYDFILKLLAPALLNKRPEGTHPEADLRLLKCLSTLEKFNKSCDFLLEQVLESLCKNLLRFPHLIKHTLSLVNSMKENPDPFLNTIHQHVQVDTLDSETIAEIRASMANSNEPWKELQDKLISAHIYKYI